MKLKKILLICLLCVYFIPLFGQNITFQYDDNGNRTSRTLNALKSATVKFPITNANSIPTIDSATLKSSDKNKAQVDESIQPKVYPNPTKGIINIEFNYLPEGARTEIICYNLTGKELLVKKNFDRSTDLDVSKLKDGIYILRIVVGDSMFDWKIIKRQ